MTRVSLRARIATTCAIAIAVALTGMAAAAYVVVDHEMYRSLDLDLSRAAILATRNTTQPSDLCQYLAAPPCVQTVSSTHDPGLLPVTTQTHAVAAGTEPAYYSDSTLAGYPVRIFTTQLRSGVAIQVALRTDRIQDSLDRIAIALGIATAIGLAVAIAAGITAARTGLRPLTALTATAERVATTANPDQHIEVDGRDEVARLAETLNIMLGVLHRSLLVQRRFVADASHELRTPLTALRANVDLLGRRLDTTDRDRVIRAARTQAVELTHLVGDLLDLARAEDPNSPANELRQIELDTVISHCVRLATQHWPDIPFHTELEPTTYAADPDRIARAIGNLLDNAAKFSPPGSGVDVVLRAGELMIRDHGPGIPADDLPHVFDRFYRSPHTRDRPGSGIGLAVVKQITDAHGAQIIINNATDGGTVARLILT